MFAETIVLQRNTVKPFLQVHSSSHLRRESPTITFIDNNCVFRPIFNSQHGDSRVYDLLSHGRIPLAATDIRRSWTYDCHAPHVSGVIRFFHSLRGGPRSISNQTVDYYLNSSFCSTLCILMDSSSTYTILSHKRRTSKRKYHVRKCESERGSTRRTTHKRPTDGSCSQHNSLL